MNQCLKVSDFFPPASATTLFVYKSGRTKYLAKGALTKAKAEEILNMIPDVYTGNLRIFVEWIGNIFELTSEDMEQYAFLLKEFA